MFAKFSRELLFAYIICREIHSQDYFCKIQRRGSPVHHISFAEWTLSPDMVRCVCGLSSIDQKKFAKSEYLVLTIFTLLHKIYLSCTQLGRARDWTVLHWEIISSGLLISVGRKNPPSSFNSMRNQSKIDSWRMCVFVVLSFSNLFAPAVACHSNLVWSLPILHSTPFKVLSCIPRALHCNWPECNVRASANHKH